MLLWAKHWADWVRNEWIPLSRTRRGGIACHVSHEAGGRSYSHQPIPWSAEVVTVEMVLRLPPVGRKKADFALHFPDTPAIPADAVRPDSGDRFRVVFRFPVPRLTSVGVVVWKCYRLASVMVPVLTAGDFRSGLTLGTPTLAARLGTHFVGGRAISLGGCRGLLATAVLRSPYRLAPAGDLGLSAVFRCERTGRTFEVAVPFTAEQRNATEALVAALCPCVPRRPGWWSVTWRAGDWELATERLEAVSVARFEEGVRLLDARFAVVEKGEPVRLVRQPPVPGTFDRIGPCFLVVAEQGTAGLASLAVQTVSPGGSEPISLPVQEVLLTDAPLAFMPGLLEAVALGRVGGFELRLNGRVLGVSSLSPVPPAALTAEGGFKPPPDFPWTTAGEDELRERLGRLGNLG